MRAQRTTALTGPRRVNATILPDQTRLRSNASFRADRVPCRTARAEMPANRSPASGRPTSRIPDGSSRQHFSKLRIFWDDAPAELAQWSGDFALRQDSCVPCSPPSLLGGSSDWNSKLCDRIIRSTEQARRGRRVPCFSLVVQIAVPPSKLGGDERAIPPRSNVPASWIARPTTGAYSCRGDRPSPPSSRTVAPVDRNYVIVRRTCTATRRIVPSAFGLQHSRDQILVRWNSPHAMAAVSMHGGNP